MNTNGRQPHILIVDDAQEILDLLQELLEDEGYRITTSRAILDPDKIKELGPDVIMHDLLFEQMQEQGWRSLALVRLDPVLSEIPLVLCTAAVSVVRDEDMAEKLRQLRVRVVLKPFNLDELLATLSEVQSTTVSRMVLHS